MLCGGLIACLESVVAVTIRGLLRSTCVAGQVTRDSRIEFDHRFGLPVGSLISIWGLRLRLTPELWALRIVEIWASLRVLKLAVDFQIALEGLKASLSRIWEALADGVRVTTRGFADVNNLDIGFQKICTVLRNISAISKPASHDAA